MAFAWSAAATRTIVELIGAGGRPRRVRVAAPVSGSIVIADAADHCCLGPPGEVAITKAEPAPQVIAKVKVAPRGRAGQPCLLWARRPSDPLNQPGYEKHDRRDGGNHGNDGQ